VSGAIHVDLMNGQFQPFTSRPFRHRATIDQTLGMRNDPPQWEFCKRGMKQRLIAPEHQDVDVVMLPCDTAQEAVDRPSTGYKPRRRQAGHGPANFKQRLNVCHRRFSSPREPSAWGLVARGQGWDGACTAFPVRTLLRRSV